LFKSDVQAIWMLPSQVPFEHCLKKKAGLNLRLAFGYILSL